MNGTKQAMYYFKHAKNGSNNQKYYAQQFIALYSKLDAENKAKIEHGNDILKEANNYIHKDS